MHVIKVKYRGRGRARREDLREPLGLVWGRCFIALQGVLKAR